MVQPVFAPFDPLCRALNISAAMTVIAKMPITAIEIRLGCVDV